MRKKGCGAGAAGEGLWREPGGWRMEAEGMLAVTTRALQGPGRRQPALCLAGQEAPWRKGPEQGSEPRWGRAGSIAWDALGQKLG